MQFLKEHLGDELFAQVEEKLKDNKDVKLANLAEGQHVGIGKFQAAHDKAEKLESTLAERDAQLAELKEASGSVDDLKEQITALQGANEEAKASFDKEMADAALNHAVDLAIASARPVDNNAAKAIKGLIKMNAVSFVDEKLTGFTDQLDSLRENSAYLFEGKKKVSDDGGNPPNTGEEEGGTEFDKRLEAAIVGSDAGLTKT